MGYLPAAAPAAGTPIGDLLAALQRSRYMVSAAPTYTRASADSLTNNQARITVTMENVGGSVSNAATPTITFFFTASNSGVTFAYNPATMCTKVEAKYLPKACQ